MRCASSTTTYSAPHSQPPTPGGHRPCAQIDPIRALRSAAPSSGDMRQLGGSRSPLGSQSVTVARLPRMRFAARTVTGPAERGHSALGGSLGQEERAGQGLPPACAARSLARARGRPGSGGGVRGHRSPGPAGAARARGLGRAGPRSYSGGRSGSSASGRPDPVSRQASCTPSRPANR
jgi:hypothetical protein